MKKRLQPFSKQLDNERDELPPKLGQPARRALIRAGCARLEDLARLTEAEAAKLHGIGPKAMEQLRSALAATGRTFANPE